MITQVSRRALMVGAAMAVALAACGEQKQAEAPVTPYEVEEKSISQLAEDLAAKKTTAVAVTQGYIDRIKMYDGVVQSVIAVAPDALAQAQASDARRAEGKALGPLDGIPILLKDNIDALGMATTAGSYALEFNVPAADAPVTKKLRDAGAILTARVAEQAADGLTRLDTPAGPLWLPRVQTTIGHSLRVRIAASDVMLALTRPEGLSALNVLPATVRAVRDGDGPGTLVQLDLGGQALLARVTRRSATALGLQPGLELFAVVKSVSVAQGDVGEGPR